MKQDKPNEITLTQAIKTTPGFNAVLREAASMPYKEELTIPPEKEINGRFGNNWVRPKRKRRVK